jgi:hypothetical protein
MNPTLPLWVLLVGAPTTFSSPNGSVGRGASMQTELERFSAGWSVRFQEVAPARAPDPNDGSTLCERVEALLDAAQTALGALRTAEAEDSLAEARRLLEAHPELPQAAWLAAERDNLAADLVEPRDPDAARALRTRAMVLEGRRAAPFKEAGSREPRLSESATSRVTVSGLAARDELEWDAVPASTPLEASPGEHQLRVLRNNRVVWASWVKVEGMVSEVPVTAPAIVPCSADDLDGTVAGTRGPVAPAWTRCPNWAVARVDGKKLLVSLCRESACGPWRPPPEPTPANGTNAQREKSGFPRWALYAAAGVGAAAITALIIAQSGVLAGSPSSERWVYGGLH